MSSPATGVEVEVGVAVAVEVGVEVGVEVEVEVAVAPPTRPLMTSRLECLTHATKRATGPRVPALTQWAELLDIAIHAAYAFSEKRCLSEKPVAERDREELRR